MKKLARAAALTATVLSAVAGPALSASATTLPPGHIVHDGARTFYMFDTPRPLYIPGVPHKAVRVTSDSVAPNDTVLWTYPIYNSNSGLCLDDYHSIVADGNKIDQYACNGSRAQTWAVDQVGTDSATGDAIVAILSDLDFNAVVEIPSSSKTAGTAADLWAWDGTYTQEWVLNDNQGLLTFRNVNSGMYLEVAQSSQSSGATVDQWPGNGTDTQHWYKTG